MSMRTVHLVDDDDEVRASLFGLLSSHSNLCIHAFRSGDAFLGRVEELEPGVVLLDHDMPGATGMDVLSRIGGDRDFVPIMLTGKGNIPLAAAAIKSGAIDFVEKPYDPATLLEILEVAFQRLEKDNADRARVETARATVGRLSGREKDVLLGLIDGQTNKVIAYDLGISTRTVEAHRARLMEKLDVRSLSEALRIAFAANLIPAV